MKLLATKIKDHRLVLVVFAIELLHFFFFRKDLEFIFSPLLFLGCGGFYYFYLINKPQLFYLEKSNETKARIPFWHYMLLAFLFIGVFVFTQYLINTYPIDVKDSDIIPLIMKVYVERFVQGASVYAPFTGFNYGTFVPNYMPFHWLPFVLSAITSLDPRMVHSLVFCVALLALLYRNYKVSVKPNEFIWKAILPFVFYFLILIKQGKDYAVTVELVIAAYYVLLGLSLFSSSKFFQVIAMGMALLSRYSLVFWLPVWALVKFLYQRKTAFILFGGLALFVCLFYIFPFVWPNPEVLQKGSNLWVDAALNEWDGQDWQPIGDRPFQLFQGLGFASWFQQFYPGTLTEKLIACKNALIASGILGMFFLAVARFKNQQTEQRLFLLLSLKLSLSIFYAFVFIPYVYLYWVPLCLSLVILVQMKWEKTTT